MADHETGLREDVVLRDPSLDVHIRGEWDQVGGIDGPADGHQHPCRQAGDGIECGTKYRAGLRQMSKHAPEGDVDQRPVVVRPPIGQRSGGFVLDPRLGDSDLYLRDAQAIRRGRRRVLARLPYDKQRL